MVQLVDELSEGVTVFDYIGLEVSAHHCSGYIETITLGNGYIPGYPASYAPPELHTACAVGTNWSVHVFNTGTRLGFCFRGLGLTEICGFEIHALDSARMVFDRTNPAPGSMGSGNGLDARIEAYGYTFYGFRNHRLPRQRRLPHALRQRGECHGPPRHGRHLRQDVHRDDR